MLKSKSVLVLAVVALAVAGCQSRRKKEAPAKPAETAGEAAAPRAEFAWRLQCKEIDPYKSFEGSGRARPDPNLAKEAQIRLITQKNAEADAAGKLLRDAAKKCGVPDNVVSRARPLDLPLQSSKVTSETPDGTVNVTVQVMGKDILDLLGAVSRN